MAEDEVKEGVVTESDPESGDLDDFDSDEGGGLIDAGDSTSFDDVALSLLLFFMVLSLFASFEDTKEKAQGKGTGQLPVAGGVLDLGDMDLRNRINVVAEDDNLVLIHTTQEGKEGNRFIIGAQDKRARQFKKKLLELTMQVQPEAVEDPSRDGILVIIRLPRDTPYSRFIWVWYAITKLHRKHPAFKDRVAMVTWGSESQLEAPGG